MEKIYKIYCLTAPDGRRYIGTTGRQYLSMRWVHGVGYRECPAIYAAIQQYGWDSFAKSVLEECTDADIAFEREKYWVSYFQTSNPTHGFNLQNGGKTGFTQADSTKAKISASHTGMTHSPETKAKLRELALMRPPASPEICAKISAANFGNWVSPEGRERRRANSTGRIMSEEAKQKIRESKQCFGNRTKKVRCIETGDVFRSARDASLSMGKSKGAVTRAIHSGTACCGHHFEYLTKGVEEFMPISESKERTNIILPKSIKDRLRKIADEQNRSLSNLIITIILEYLEKQ